MAFMAWEIKNLFFYSLRDFELSEIEKLWKKFKEEKQSTDAYEFLFYLKRTSPERFKG